MEHVRKDRQARGEFTVGHFHGTCKHEAGVFRQRILRRNAGQQRKQNTFFFDNSRAIGGVIVLNQISHEQMQGAESVTYLRFTFQLQMDSFLSSPFDILEYSEQLQFSDNQGLPLQVARVPIYGQPIIQNVSTASFYYATQSGTAKLRTPNPNPEPPLFPNSFSGEDGSRQVAYTSPKMIRGVPVEYGVNWSYRFRSATPLFSSVNARG